MSRFNSPVAETLGGMRILVPAVARGLDGIREPVLKELVRSTLAPTTFVRIREQVIDDLRRWFTRR